MKPAQTNSEKTGAWLYLRTFSYFLMICGAFTFVIGAAILYTAFVDSVPADVSLSLSTLILGVVEMGIGGVTVATGILGRSASMCTAKLPSLYTLALAGVVTTVLCMGLCHALNDNFPTSLLFNGLLLVVCMAITNNLKKHA